MQPRITGGIYRISAMAPELGISFNQFLMDDERPTLNLSEAMLGLYRAVGIFAHENPVGETVDRLEALAPKWVHAMHGGTIAGDALAPYTHALREREFGRTGCFSGGSHERPRQWDERA